MSRLASAALLIVLLLTGCGKSSNERVLKDPLTPSGTIAVCYEGELWLLAADGSGKRKLHFGSDWAGGAALSPNGRRVIFDTLNGVWVAPAVGGEARLLRGLPAAIARPSFDASWGPGGRSVVFAGEQGIYVLAVNGRQAARLLFDDVETSAPRWSQDGSQIAFVRGRVDRPDRQAIWLVSLNGRHSRFLVRGSDPTFSPDGSRLAYSGAGGVYVLRLAGGQPRLLVRRGYQPVWSPSGAYIAFKRHTTKCDSAGCHERIWLVRRSDGAARPLKPEFFVSGRLSWTETTLPKHNASIKTPDQ